MASISAVISFPLLQSAFSSNRILVLKSSISFNRWVYQLRLISSEPRRGARLKASEDSVVNTGRSQDGSFTEEKESNFYHEKTASSVQAPTVISVIQSSINSRFVVGLCVVIVFISIVARKVISRHSPSHEGSVADLVRRGQLKSDRRGISKPLSFEDPFNNPLVKVGKNNSTVEVCGKVYRLAPVALTKEQQSQHQKRRSRAYEWTRPKVFLREGDTIPPNIDPTDVRWIPANHPFATTVTDIDEELARNNIHQKHGVPFRIKAEHEAMQRKFEQLQSEQKLNDVVEESILRDIERPSMFSDESDNQPDVSFSIDQWNGTSASKSDLSQGEARNCASEES